MTANKNARLIAFYLPQYFPIPENNKWWGNGFTEWTNVTKAKPLYKGHQQPKFPADLGFYDLRVPEVREQQAKLASDAGIEGFCYWHYWFGNGTRILERVFKEVLDAGKPDFPFCLAWANQTWTGHWHGNEKDVLIEQTYGGKEDYTNHFYEVLPAFKDKRYIQVDSKPVFIVYNPSDIPDIGYYTELWRSLAAKEGLKGIYFIAMANKHHLLSDFKMDATMDHEPTSHKNIKEKPVKKWLRKQWGFKENPQRVNYSDFVDSACNEELPDNKFPVVVPNWDNTPRSGKNGLVYENSNPILFKKHLAKALNQIKPREEEHKLIFIKSWNEWAEGNFLEPDCDNGMALLNTLKETLREQ